MPLARLADRREPRPAGAHGASSRSRRPWSTACRAAHRADAETCFTTSRASPDRIVNKTNGITFPALAAPGQPGPDALLVGTSASGAGDDPRSCAKSPSPMDDAFRRASARRRSPRTRSRSRSSSPSRRASSSSRTALFDVQIKRIHEYKRQLLNLLETSRSTMRSCENPDTTGCRA